MEEIEKIRKELANLLLQKKEIESKYSTILNLIEEKRKELLAARLKENEEKMERRNR